MTNSAFAVWQAYGYGNVSRSGSESKIVGLCIPLFSIIALSHACQLLLSVYDVVTAPALLG